MRGAASHRQSGAPGKLRRDFPISRAHLRLPPAPSVAPQGGGRAAQAEPPGGRHPGAPVHRGICAHAWCSGTRKRSPFLLTVWERASGPPPPRHPPSVSGPPALLHPPTPPPPPRPWPPTPSRHSGSVTALLPPLSVGHGDARCLGGSRAVRPFRPVDRGPLRCPGQAPFCQALYLMTIQHGWQLLPSPPLPPGLPAAPFTF